MVQSLLIKQEVEKIDKHLGMRLRSIRRERGLSQGKVGDYLGITFQQIQKYERGDQRLSASTLVLLSRGLSVSVAYFFDGLVQGEGIPVSTEQPLPHLSVHRKLSDAEKQLKKSLQLVEQAKDMLS